MKNLSDWTQVFLSDDSILGWLSWALLVTLALAVLKALWGSARAVLGFLWRYRYTVLLRPSWSLLIWVIIGSTAAWSYRSVLNAQWQYVEEIYLHPVYANADTSSWALSCYEQELRRHVSDPEFRIIRQKVAETAILIGSTPLDIYEVAYSECGLDPFAVNVSPQGDTLACGFIQFTRNGCTGLMYAGAPLTMRMVKDWGKTRNVSAMLDATRDYLVSRADGVSLSSATQVYVAVFAPGYIGKGPETVLYAKSTDPAAYRLNAGLDGYGIEQGRVARLPKFMDGKITIADMSMHLMLKRSRFLAQQFTTK